VDSLPVLETPDDRASARRRADSLTLLRHICRDIAVSPDEYLAA
jgi:hypothetical protein